MLDVGLSAHTLIRFWGIIMESSSSKISQVQLRSYCLARISGFGSRVSGHCSTFLHTWIAFDLHRDPIWVEAQATLLYVSMVVELGLSTIILEGDASSIVSNIITKFSIFHLDLPFVFLGILTDQLLVT